MTYSTIDKVFKLGHYIWECKTTPSRIGGHYDTGKLKQKINQLMRYWENSSTPSGYNYIFPINTLDERAISYLQEFQAKYKGEVSIKYFDCNNFQSAINAINQLSSCDHLLLSDDIQSARNLLEYIQEARLRFK